MASCKRGRCLGRRRERRQGQDEQKSSESLESVKAKCRRYVPLVKSRNEFNIFLLDFVFSPDVKYVAAISEDGCLRVIDALAEQSVFSLCCCRVSVVDRRFIDL